MGNPHGISHGKSHGNSHGNPHGISRVISHRNPMGTPTANAILVMHRELLDSMGFHWILTRSNWLDLAGLDLTEFDRIYLVAVGTPMGISMGFPVGIPIGIHEDTLACSHTALACGLRTRSSRWPCAP